MEMIHRVVTEVTTEVFGTSCPRFEKRFNVPEVHPNSSLGKSLSRELKDRASLFLAKLELKMEDWATDEWDTMLVSVRALCTDGGLTIREDGTLTASEVVLSYFQNWDFPKTKTRLFTIVVEGSFPSAETGGERAKGLIFIP